MYIIKAAVDQGGGRGREESRGEGRGGEGRGTYSPHFSIM